jgi:hypothetical protein
MAITKTENILRIIVQNPTGEVGDFDDPTIIVETEILLDDPDDNTLPVKHPVRKTIEKWVRAVIEGEDDVLTDTSGEDTMVQAVCNAVWTND